MTTETSSKLLSEVEKTIYNTGNKIGNSLKDILKRINN